MLIPDPGSRFLSKPNPVSRIRIQKQLQKRRGEKISCPTFFCSHKYHKIVTYFIFELVKKKIWAIFYKELSLSSQKL